MEDPEEAKRRSKRRKGGMMRAVAPPPAPDALACALEWFRRDPLLQQTGERQHPCAVIAGREPIPSCCEPTYLAYCNESFGELLGYHSHQMATTGLSTLIHRTGSAEEDAALRTLGRALRLGRSARARMNMQRIDGGLVSVDAHFLPMLTVTQPANHPKAAACNDEREGESAQQPWHPACMYTVILHRVIERGVTRVGGAACIIVDLDVPDGGLGAQVVACPDPPAPPVGDSLRGLARVPLPLREAFCLADPSTPDCPLTHISAGFAELTGYACDEVLGRNCRFLQGPDTDREAVKKIADSMRREERVTVRLLNYRKDGSTFLNEITVQPIRDHTGKVSQFIGVQADITSHVTLLQPHPRIDEVETNTGGDAAVSTATSCGHQMLPPRYLEDEDDLRLQAEAEAAMAQLEAALTELEPTVDAIAPPPPFIYGRSGAASSVSASGLDMQMIDQHVAEQQEPRSRQQRQAAVAPPVSASAARWQRSSEVWSGSSAGETVEDDPGGSSSGDDSASSSSNGSGSDGGRPQRQQVEMTSERISQQCERIMNQRPRYDSIRATGN